jgi:hypothetical protein
MEQAMGILSLLKPKPATSTQSSENVNNDLIKSTYAPTMQAGSGATNFLANLLGVNSGAVSSTADRIGTGANMVADGGGAQAGYQNYLQNAGYAPAMRTLSQGIVGQGAASGLLNSGATSKALLTKGTELNQQFYGNYLQQLNALAGLGIQGGGLVANTGQKSTGTSTGGGPSTIGSIASTVGGIASIFSDRRLKTDIEKIREEPDGLGIYRFRYVWDRSKYAENFGVMADEVAALRPWALGPVVGGFATVNYGAL